MAAVNKATVFITGKIYWAKVLGEPRLNYNKDGREWGFELELGKDGIAAFKKHGVVDRIKGKGYNVGQKGQFADREPFVQLKKTEFNRDGNPNPPIRVYDGNDVDWDASRLIGNESVADVKLDIRDYGVGKKSGIYPVAIRVKELVAYQSSEFGAMDGDDAEPKQSTKTEDFGKDFGLDADPLDDENPL